MATENILHEAYDQMVAFTGDGRALDFDANQVFLVCAGCVEGHEEMERDDPDCPRLLAVVR
jgi:hypothetical protein